MEPKQSDNSDSLGNKALSGAFLMIATRFTIRLLGLISVTVLARILTPTDFGLFGSAALALSFFILLREMGFGEALIKKEVLEKSDVDTIWTIRFLLSLIIALLVVVSSPTIASFLKDPRIENVLYLMALVPVIDSLASPASALLLREFKFGSDFLLKSSIKIIRVIVVIAAALILQSYWALVIGALVASAFGVIISHMVRPYRPTLSLSRLAQHGGFAAWSYIRNLSDYISRTSDEFVIRATQNTAFFGIYHIARDLSRILITELISPIKEAMLPALSRIPHTDQRFGKAITNIIGASFIVAVAIATGVAITADELILVILGPQWTEAAKYLVWLSFGTACDSIGHINQSSMIAANRNTLSANLWIARAILYSLACLITAMIGEPIHVAMVFTLLSALFLIMETRFLLAFIKAPRGLLALIYRPITAGVAMAAALYFIPWSPELPTVILLLLKVLIGAATYCLVLLILWRSSGVADAPENALIEYLPGPLKKFAMRFLKQSA